MTILSLQTIKLSKALCALLSILLLNACASSHNTTKHYASEETSLSKHQAAPKWFRDAKLGIYFTWGPYTVAAKQNEWYPRWMHFDMQDEDWLGNTPGYHHDLLGWHTENFGHPSTTPYHELFHQFTAEHFDAEEWAQLFYETGARFAGPVAIHHDGYALWDSAITPWDVKDIGPKRDITGELAQALRKRGIKLVTTFHHARNLQRYAGLSPQEALEPAPWDDSIYHAYWNSHYPWIEGLATASDDPKLQLLYGNMDEQVWLEDVWLGMLKEVVDKYQPDLVWFDTWLDQIPEKYRYEFASYYFNKGIEWGKDVMMTHKHTDMPTSFSVEDFEQGRRDELTDLPWLTDDTMAIWTWSFTNNMPLKSKERIIHEFIDIVSKNGQLLLNISPRADGSIPQNQRDILRALGAWMKVNNEAIYETRPWIVYGEGPTQMKGDGHFTKPVAYGEKDVRFTTKGEMLYAIALGTPTQELVIKSLADDLKLYKGEIAAVEALVGDVVKSWSRDSTGLRITLKDAAPKQVAYAFKIIEKKTLAKMTGLDQSSMNK
ncbi:alpha-L-fucosidase [Agaribacter flavus]|uniref:alpha-L-fucosidase n=1 Tax=Agaribacter flavus TaxID=1902781 RepID=A0ABV7FQN7_9ALTE